MDGWMGRRRTGVKIARSNQKQNFIRSIIFLIKLQQLSKMNKTKTER
jgi:hypothetical protein